MLFRENDVRSHAKVKWSIQHIAAHRCATRQVIINTVMDSERSFHYKNIQPKRVANSAKTSRPLERRPDFVIMSFDRYTSETQSTALNDRPKMEERLNERERKTELKCSMWRAGISERFDHTDIPSHRSVAISKMKERKKFSFEKNKKRKEAESTWAQIEWIARCE